MLRSASASYLLGLASTWTATQTFTTATATTFNVSGGAGFQGDSAGLKCGSGAAFLFANAANPVNTADVSITRVGAGGIKITDNSTGAGYVQTQAVAVASLPAASTAGKGARAMVNDSSVVTFNSTVAAGGANNVPVFSDGTNWKVG